MIRVQLYKENLAIIKEKKWRLSDILTGDEPWFYNRHIAKRGSFKTWVYESKKHKTIDRRGRFESKTNLTLLKAEKRLIYIKFVAKTEPCYLHRNTSYCENFLTLIQILKKILKTKMITINYFFSYRIKKSSKN